MYKKFQNFGSSNRGGASHNNSFKSHRSGGNFGGRPQGHGRPKSKLHFADPNIFVKRIQGDSTLEAAQTIHQSFAEFNIAEQIKTNIRALGFTTPTPIQDQAIQPILDGQDLIGLAQTGTGKTAAFLIPIIDKLSKQRDQRALIVAPTRELAAQINEKLRSLSLEMNIYSGLVIGGASINRQIQDARRNPQILIATPGRLKDLLERRVVRLDHFQTIVLDEVDLMVDIGFINDIKYFISLMPKVRHSLFFSATISSKIQGILQSFVQNPVTVSIKKQDTQENIQQDIVKVISANKKVDQLHDLLIKDGFNKVLIFGKTKHGIEKLNRELEFRGFKVGSIHGNKSQSQRVRALQSFKQNQIKILLATDVASRGLDIDNVTHVINYDLPETYDDYIHRIGRTGRAGKTGMALTFID